MANVYYCRHLYNTSVFYNSENLIIGKEINVIHFHNRRIIIISNETGTQRAFVHICTNKKYRCIQRSPNCVDNGQGKLAIIKKYISKKLLFLSILNEHFVFIDDLRIPVKNKSIRIRSLVKFQDDVIWIDKKYIGVSICCDLCELKLIFFTKPIF